MILAAQLLLQIATFFGMATGPAGTYNADSDEIKVYEDRMLVDRVDSVRFHERVHRHQFQTVPQLASAVKWVSLLFLFGVGLFLVTFETQFLAAAMVMLELRVLVEIHAHLATFIGMGDLLELLIAAEYVVFPAGLFIAGQLLQAEVAECLQEPALIPSWYGTPTWCNSGGGVE